MNHWVPLKVAKTAPSWSVVEVALGPKVNSPLMVPLVTSMMVMGAFGVPLNDGLNLAPFKTTSPLITRSWLYSVPRALPFIRAVYDPVPSGLKVTLLRIVRMPALPGSVPAANVPPTNTGPVIWPAVPVELPPSRMEPGAGPAKTFTGPDPVAESVAEVIGLSTWRVPDPTVVGPV